jgi:hypothetical protein
MPNDSPNEPQAEPKTQPATLQELLPQGPLLYYPLSMLGR